MQLNIPEGARCVELGGGNAPLIRPNVDIEYFQGADGQRTVDFIADFNKPLPIKDGDFDFVFCRFALEHISWQNTRAFLKEVGRILAPGGRCVFVVPDVPKQLEWILKHPGGWDGKPFFEAASEKLFGTQNYSGNFHCAYLSAETAVDLFGTAGFKNVVTYPFGERSTDLLIEAERDEAAAPPGAAPEEVPGAAPPAPAGATPEYMLSPEGRRWAFDKHYFNGGKKVGGYADEGYQDFFVPHELTARHVLSRKPSSVLEPFCARGYVLKRLQDAGVRANGMDISKHCWMIRACEGVIERDVCEAPWPYKDKEFDLSFSIGGLEHVPESLLPGVIGEMARTAARGLHGVTAAGKGDGFDRTQCSLFPLEKWRALFAEHAPGWPVEILDKEDLEKGNFTTEMGKVSDYVPPEIFQDGGLVKLNIGCSLVMYGHGWNNIDKNDLSPWARPRGYRFLAHDITKGVPCQTGTVDLITLSHVLEHFSYKDGLSLLRECRRVLKPTGAVRIAVPDASLLLHSFMRSADGGGDFISFPPLEEFGEMNNECEEAPTPMAKLHSMLQGGDHFAFYDEETLAAALTAAGFVPLASHFRQSYPEGDILNVVRKETLDMFCADSLYMNARPLTA